MVFSVVLISMLNVPPQIRSSQLFGIGNLSATRAHPIKSQSLRQALADPCDPPPTIEFTTF